MSRILVLRPGALGDVILTLPAIQALWRRWPDAEVHLMGSTPWIDLLPGRTAVASVSSFDQQDLATLFETEAAPSEGLQRYLGGFERIVSYAAGPGYAFARNLERAARGPVLHVDAAAVLSEPRHAGSSLQTPLEAWGVEPWAGLPGIRPTAADASAAELWLEGVGIGRRPFVAVHPGSGSAAKNWPAERFAQACLMVVDCLRADLVILGGPADDVEVASLRHALAGAPAVELVVGTLPLVAAVLARCALYLGNDSGVTHLAAAVGAPVVAVFGPTDPAVWGPRGERVRVVAGAAPCAPCTPEERRDCRERSCLSAVTVEMVVDAPQELV